MQMQPAPQPQPKPAVTTAASLKGAMLAGVVAVVGFGVLAAGWWGQSSPIDPPLSQAEQAARLAEFIHAGTFALPTVAPADQPVAIASMNLAPDQAQELQRRVDDGAERLVWLTLWDNCVEDGDTVALESYGVIKTIRLTHAPQRVAMPAPQGGVINVRGVYDGGGGITVAIMSGATPVSMPVMAVGQVLGVPVAVAP